MNFEQDENENMMEFILRLQEAGWERSDAVAEWERIQDEQEDNQ